MNDLREIAISDITVRADRVRPLDEAAAEGLAQTIEAEGLLQPITVREVSEGFELVAGRHRLAACTALHWAVIPAMVVRGDDTDVALMETLENLARNELSALEKAAHFARFKLAYEAKYGPVQRGGDRRSPEATDQSPDLGLWSFNDTIAERTGFKRSTIFAYVAVWTGLDHGQYERLCALPQVADNFSQLRVLAAQSHDRQDHALGLIENGKAATVGDAISMIDDVHKPSPAEKRVTVARGAWLRLNQTERQAFLADNEDEVRRFAVERGWIVG
ncbi:MAG: ParB/RepB/Spo0J family partition protein [Pseudomonadota bacterium]